MCLCVCACVCVCVCVFVCVCVCVSVYVCLCVCMCVSACICVCLCLCVCLCVCVCVSVCVCVCLCLFVILSVRILFVCSSVGKRGILKYHEGYRHTLCVDECMTMKEQGACGCNALNYAQPDDEVPDCGLFDMTLCPFDYGTADGKNLNNTHKSL